MEHEILEDITPDWTSFRDNLTKIIFNEWRVSSLKLFNL